jgi:hypothetical protein
MKSDGIRETIEENDKSLKRFDVKIYFSGYCSYEIEAKDAGEAIEKARQLPINNDKVLSTLENWFEADEAEEISDDSQKYNRT